jgi:Ca-activated chloride channel family protein
MEDIRLEYPWALVLLLAIPIVVYAKRKHVRATGFSDVALLGKELQPGVVKQYGPECLGVLFMIALVLAIGNIQYASYWEKSYLESKWIMIVQDLSGSMGRPAGGESGMTLGDVALQGAESFVEGRHEDDLIGVVAFSSFARLISPPTFDKEILKKKLFLMSRKSDSIVHRELTLGGATNASYAAWLALSVFFVLLPEESQLSIDEIDTLRYSLLGRTLRRVEVPEKLRRAGFGHGMAIVLFTDGRIEANKSDEDVRKGLPNFVNVVKLIQQLGVKLYLIVVGGDVNQEVKMAIESANGSGPVGQIFYMPRTFQGEKIEEVYEKIDDMEKNRLLTRIQKKKRETRWLFAWIAWGLLSAYCFVRLTPWFRRM